MDDEGQVKPANPEQPTVNASPDAPVVIEPTLSNIEPSPVVPQAVSAPAALPAAGVTWTASEFLEHHKSSVWYLKLGIAAAAVAVIIYLLTHDLISSIVVVVAAIALGVLAARQPRQLDYRLDGSGLSIGPKYYPYDSFRSFAVVPEAGTTSIIFMPLKRFAPPITIYFAPEQEEQIVAVLSDRLPVEPYSHDALDRLMRRIHF